MTCVDLNGALLSSTHVSNPSSSATAPSFTSVFDVAFLSVKCSSGLAVNLGVTLAAPEKEALALEAIHSVCGCFFPVQVRALSCPFILDPTSISMENNDVVIVANS